jgi:hypothetical protein
VVSEQLQTAELQTLGDFVEEDMTPPKMSYGVMTVKIP